MKFIQLLVFICTLLFLNVLEQYKNTAAVKDEPLLQTNAITTKTPSRDQAGSIHSLNDSTVISESQINRYIKQKSTLTKLSTSRLLVWNDKQRNILSLSAMGLDWQHHFASSYLVGIRPFAVENNWLPLYTISKMKTYEFDHKQYGIKEMWQNSAQAYSSPRGDCEDHALILADWLISEGIDARVAAGKYKNEGHAWVVAIVEGKTFILEATNKRAQKSWNSYPLAKLATHYYPKYMFNRTNFWIKKSDTPLYSYHEKHWSKNSVFKRDNKKPAS